MPRSGQKAGHAWKKTGFFADDVQFADMSYKQAKEIALRRGAKEEKNPVKEIAAARDTINELKTEYSHLDPQSPQAAQIMEKIRDGEAALSRMKAPTEAMSGDKPPSGYRWNKNKPGELEKITGGPADKDARDVMQADALSAYRASYPMGFMPDIYGKGQPTPEAYVEKYIQNKESGGKGLPKKDETVTRFEGDKEMKGMTLGKKTPKGHEVLKGGKLVGYYQ